MSVSPPRSEPDERRRSPASDSASGNGQLSRLLQLVVALQTDSFPNAGELARLCEVSRRTIYRDIEILSSAGFLVNYRADRQGYELARSCPIPPPSLDEREALALLVLARQWTGGDGLGLLRVAREAAAKVVQGLPAEVRNRVIYRAEVIPFQPGADDEDADRRVIHDAILDGLARRRQLRLWYRDADGRTVESTKFSLYCLARRRGIWCLIGRSSLHRGVRAIRVPRIQRVVITDDAASIPPRFSLERFLGQAWAVERGSDRHQVHLSFSARVAPEVRETVWHPGRRFEPRGDGRLDLHLAVDGLDEIVGWVLGFGAQVEVVSPPELRARVRDEALRVARLCGFDG
jgi:predicted DNA-binding transcriptional regulator YafY